ncbi:2-polyprenyl-3-methyl-5-hydroxy-6-metoxy-1,4-benzoquinol methylase [Pedobacter africanus]|uniref:2-polyprenyl-3-methyl-5-hydroxy-6-metoxy-1, 4-benzoquinol methylase n=1 Tax=Pedobacter africanus TaxID=151894 RepID=A0ACC6KUG4_9SPHI|nr:methyltransferase domain-containing protein [Pedobacter africanus]MDR6782861.1 2-polyprenyl-3-methyl-5-hydroxy-6-metoxy-1,4-benzoquinol methylase [Pedobacter africanus]
MIIDTTNRSEVAETMDDFSMEGEILKDALDKIARINQLLGGNKVTLNGLKQLINKQNREREISILDVGCGNGDMLRFLADYAGKKGLKFKLTGIDANAFTIGHARQLSVNYTQISYRCADISEELKQDQTYDVILCTLTLHHFKNTELLQLMAGFKSKTNMGIVVNDLHRSAIAYYLFMAICFVFGLNKMSRDDGLISILRGFKKKELLTFSKQLNLKNYTLRWCWAFRYQWVIATI